MKKVNNVRGLVTLLLFAILLSAAVTALRQGQGGFGPDLDGTLRIAGLILCVLAVLSVFFASKGRRLRMALMLAAAAGIGLLLGRLRLSRGMSFLVYLGVLAVYFLGCILFNCIRYRRALRPLNEAALAYQRDQDGEKFLEALDRCAPRFPKEALLKRQDTGTVTFQEHIVCERIEVLGKMGRLKERQALIDQLRRETERKELLAWLDKKEAEFSIDFLKDERQYE